MRSLGQLEETGKKFEENWNSKYFNVLGPSLVSFFLWVFGLLEDHNLHGLQWTELFLLGQAATGLDWWLGPGELQEVHSSMQLRILSCKETNKLCYKLLRRRKWGIRLKFRNWCLKAGAKNLITYLILVFSSECWANPEFSVRLPFWWLSLSSFSCLSTCSLNCITWNSTWQFRWGVGWFPQPRQISVLSCMPEEKCRKVCADWS